MIPPFLRAERVAARPPLPSDRFARWVAGYGVANLTRSLRVHRSSIQYWITATPNRRRPHPDLIPILIKLSQARPCGVGPLDWTDFNDSPDAYLLELVQPEERKPKLSAIDLCRAMENGGLHGCF